MSNRRNERTWRLEVVLSVGGIACATALSCSGTDSAVIGGLPGSGGSADGGGLPSGGVTGSGSASNGTGAALSGGGGALNAGGGLNAGGTLATGGSMGAGGANGRLDAGASGASGLDAGATSDASSGDAGAACARGQFRCAGDVLERCAANLSGFDVVTTCAPGRCDAKVGRCTGGPLCGNGALDANEQCDGTNLGGGTCASATFGARPRGVLRCSAQCTFNANGCVANGTGGATGTDGGTATGGATGIDGGTATGGATGIGGGTGTGGGP